ncbi:MAG: hypothetical protein AAGD25_03190 [Cyanobacteria bacterium P01_F01_bin.150]
MATRLWRGTITDNASVNYEAHVYRDDSIYALQGNGVVFHNNAQEWLRHSNGSTNEKHEKYEFPNFWKGHWDYDWIYEGNVQGTTGDDIIYGQTTQYATEYEGGVRRGSFTIPGLTETLKGGRGRDIIDGRDGSDTIYGNEGNDILFSGDLTSNYSDKLWGGADADTFFLGEFTQTTTQTIDAGKFDFGKLAWDISTDLSNLVFEVGIGFGPAGFSARLAKTVAPMAIKGVKALLGNDWNKAQTVTIPDANAAGYATVEDFSTAEDILIIPLAAGGDLNVFISNDTNGKDEMAFKYGGTQAGDKTFATVNFDWANAKREFGLTDADKTTYIEASKAALRENALMIGHANGGNKIQVGFDHNDTTITRVGQDITASLPTGFKNEFASMKGRFMILGAYNGYTLTEENKDSDDFRFGTKLNDTFIANFGSDKYYGGRGSDTVSYANANGYEYRNDRRYDQGPDSYDVSRGIRANLTTGIVDDNFVNVDPSGNLVTQTASFDRLYGIENIIGTDRMDHITGNSSKNQLDGGAGNDTLKGGQATIPSKGGQVTTTWMEVQGVILPFSLA